jgi:hypothetical protein
LDGEARQGFSKFASLVKQNYVRIEPLSLLGTNTVPTDCNLLIIAGPTVSIPTTELEKIDAYLNRGGKLFALLNAESIGKDTGVERIVGNWGVAVGNVIIKDPDHSEKGDEGDDMVVSAFASHPLVNPLLGNGLYLIRPRPVGKFTGRTPPADAPRVSELLFTGPKAYIDGAPKRTLRQFPLAAALEKGAIRLLSEPTRMVIVGESFFLSNGEIDSAANRDFVGYALNWLLDRPELLVGIGPQPVKEYKLIMTRAQMQATEWLLLGGMPGCVLLLGALVWWRRRR